MKIMVLNGSNLNMLGIREPDIYGTSNYNQLCELIEKYCVEHKIDVSIFQTNHEGELVDLIQQAYFEHYDAIVINPGAYTHTSIAIMDAVKSVKLPTVEVHISELEKREDFRHISYIGLACVKTIKGEGLNGYIHAIEFLKEYLNEGNNK